MKISPTDEPYRRLAFNVVWRRMILDKINLLRRYGLRQSHVAKALGWSEAALSRYLRGESDPPISKVAELVDLFSLWNHDRWGRDDTLVKEIKEKAKDKKYE